MKDQNVFTQQPVDEQLYNSYMNLKFAEIGGAQLKQEDKDQLAAWEIELKQQVGRIAKRSVRAAIGAEQFLMLEGFPVPEHFVKVFREKGSEDYYLHPQE